MDFHYLVKELWFRRRRTLTATIGLAVGMAVMITMNALSSAYTEAARRPLEEIGADLTVQRAGDVPENLSGPVFACSTVTIRKNETDRIRTLAGVQGVAQALLIWVFDPDRFTIVLGLDPSNPNGPGVLRTQLTDGNFLEKGKRQALVETAFARKFTINTGDTVSVAGEKYPVVGIVDASRASKIAVANIYLPLSEARKIAVAAKQVQAVSPFEPEDANLLFIKAAPGKIASLTQSIQTIMGDKASVATPTSLLKRLGNLFALSDRFAQVSSLMAIVVTLFIVVKTMAANLTERAGEIGILKAVGWSNGLVMRQMVGEAILQCLIGGTLGLMLAMMAAWVLGFMQVRIPIPWEMSPTPHFMPGGGDPILKTLRLPVHISWRMAGAAVGLSTFIGAVTGGFLSRRIARIKPSEVLRYE
ncbi:MAG: ABC transporter permease [Desulfosarcinaceae bacterium]|jgi:putative ABC transport system permease protein